MIFYSIRLKDNAKFIGKKSPTCALISDQELSFFENQKPGRDHLILEAYWFVAERYAKIWNDLRDVIRFVNSSTGRGKGSKMTSNYIDLKNQTFSHYELVGSDGSCVPLDSVL